ncbi:MAG: TetR/AcrR family transcriptional regulator [Planctomycetota bacterium]|jgi:AcrR family transcriptional regulator
MDDNDAKTQILEAAYARLSQMPYQKMSLEMVAKDAGVSKALVLYHYQNKRELTRAALQRGFMRTIDEFQFDEELDDEMVKAILPALFRFTYDSMYLFVSFIEVIDMDAHSNDELAGALREMYSLFIGKLSRFLEAKGDPYPHEKAMLIALAVDMIGMAAHMEEKELDIDRYVAAVLDILHVEVGA